MSDSICSISDCDKPVEKNRNVCAMHRARFKRYQSYDVPKEIITTCCVEGCSNPRRKKPDGRFKGRMCGMHAARWHAYKSYELPDRTKPTEGVVKTCKIHGDLSIDDVYIQRYGMNKDSRYKPDYVWYDCKNCYKERSKKYHEKNKSKSHQKYLIREYGVTLEHYNKLFHTQNGLCAICKEKETATFRGKVKNLSVDHCHKTGKIRSLLCGKCNSGIGQFNDSTEILQAAIDYLKKWGE